MIILEDMVNLKKLLELFREMISFNHIDQTKISDLQMLELMILVISYMFLTQGISKILQLLNQLK